MEQERLFDPIKPTQDTIRLDDIAPWTNDGAMSPIKASISALGMLDPVTVQALPEGQPYRYKVRAGKRRLTSCRDLGLESAPAVVLPAEMGEVEAALVPLTENILRWDNPLHEAREIRSFFDACIASGMPEGEIRPYLTGLGFPASVDRQQRFERFSVMLRHEVLRTPQRRTTRRVAQAHPRRRGSYQNAYACPHPA